MTNCLQLKVSEQQQNLFSDLKECQGSYNHVLLLPIYYAAIQLKPYSHKLDILLNEIKESKYIDKFVNRLTSIQAAKARLGLQHHFIPGYK